MTAYYKRLLRPNETVLHIGKLHWRVYLRALGIFWSGPLSSARARLYRACL